MAVHIASSQWSSTILTDLAVESVLALLRAFCDQPPEDFPFLRFELRQQARLYSRAVIVVLEDEIFEETESLTRQDFHVIGSMHLTAIELRAHGRARTSVQIDWVLKSGGEAIVDAICALLRGNERLLTIDAEEDPPVGHSFDRRPRKAEEINIHESVRSRPRVSAIGSRARATLEEILALISRCFDPASNKSVEGFCMDVGTPYSTFRNWLDVLEKEELLNKKAHLIYWDRIENGSLDS